MRVGVIAMLVVVVAAAEPASVWNYRPLVAYEDESLVATLPVAAAMSWNIDDGAGQSVAGDITQGERQITVQVVAQGHERARFVSSDGHVAVLRFVRPGQAHDLTMGDDGLPLCGGVPAVLVLSRLEARADRRWSLLREGLDAHSLPCAVTLSPPVVPQGRPVLVAQCAASQAIDPRGGVLVELSGLDRVAGWKHREYRQVLAWLVCDLQARTAGHVALAGPCGAAIYNDDLAPLRAQVEDVANAYRCRVVNTTTLTDHAYWEIQPGLLGTSFNAKGVAVHDELMAPWLATAPAR